jgi:hypothetical protein
MGSTRGHTVRADRRSARWYRKKLSWLALVAIIALIPVSCDSDSGTKTNEARSVGTGSTAPSDPSMVTAFISPLTDEQAIQDLFEVEADHGQYWRVFTLDRYNGGLAWTSEALDRSGRSVRLSTPATLPQSGEPPPGAEILKQTVRILSRLPVRALPVAQTAEEIGGRPGDIFWDPTRSQALIEGGVEAGMTYTVRSRIVVPTPAELDRVQFLAPRTYGLWTELPADLDPRIRDIATRWTAGATSDYRKVLAIQQHFQDGSFVYSQDVEIATGSPDLLRFLTQTNWLLCALLNRDGGHGARIGDAGAHRGWI